MILHHSHSNDLRSRDIYITDLDVVLLVAGHRAPAGGAPLDAGNGRVL